MTAMTSGQLTEDVLAAYSGTPDPRLRQLLAALIAHLHAFAVQTRLTPAEWQAAIEFLTATGRACDAERQEFILLSDVLGLYLPGRPRQRGAGRHRVHRARPVLRRRRPAARARRADRPAADGSPALVRGRVTDTGGRPLPGATLDVWQCSGNGLYDTQDPGQPPTTCAACSPPGRTADMNSDGAPGQLPHSGRRAGG